MSFSVSMLNLFLHPFQLACHAAEKWGNHSVTQNPVYGATVTHWSRAIATKPSKPFSPCENLALSHMITNHVITIAGDDATCIAYVQARHFLPNDSGDSTQTMFGYYTNRFVRTSAGWKIRACKLTLTWQTGNPHIFTLASALLKASEAAKKS
jgi:SnoaL-like domain